MITRRRALAGFLAAPAIVRIASIMPVRTPPLAVADDLAVGLPWRDVPFGMANTIAAYNYLMELPAPPYARLLRAT